jgi:hypothetical protein
MSRLLIPLRRVPFPCCRIVLRCRVGRVGYCPPIPGLSRVGDVVQCSSWLSCRGKVGVVRGDLYVLVDGLGADVVVVRWGGVVGRSLRLWGRGLVVMRGGGWRWCIVVRVVAAGRVRSILWVSEPLVVAVCGFSQ